MKSKFKLPYEPPQILDLGAGVAYAQPAAACSSGGSPGNNNCAAGSHAANAQCRNGAIPRKNQCHTGSTP
ncbi:MAG: hypothetical protein ABSE05_03480 [Syntrophales bacterium]